MILAALSLVLARAAPHRQSRVCRRLRHPICASMLGSFLATGLAWWWWPLFLGGLALFLAGTEIRIAAEERLLPQNFPTCAEYRARTGGCIPFTR